MFAMCHDFRYMKKGKGFLCLPEIDLKMSLPYSMTHIITAKVSAEAYTELLFGRRFTSDEAAELRIINEAVPADNLMEFAMMKAKHLKKKDKNRKNLT